MLGMTTCFGTPQRWAQVLEEFETSKTTRLTLWLERQTMLEKKSDTRNNPNYCLYVL